jgi:phosphate starvation-inducible protein PhoH
MVELDESDIVRHRLVQDIVRAYDEKHPRREQHGGDFRGTFQLLCPAFRK